MIVHPRVSHSLIICNRVHGILDDEVKRWLQHFTFILIFLFFNFFLLFLKVEFVNLFTFLCLLLLTHETEWVLDVAESLLLANDPNIFCTILSITWPRIVALWDTVHSGYVIKIAIGISTPFPFHEIQTKTERMLAIEALTFACTRFVMRSCGEER